MYEIYEIYALLYSKEMSGRLFYANYSIMMHQIWICAYSNKVYVAMEEKNIYLFLTPKLSYDFRRLEI